MAGTPQQVSPEQLPQQLVQKMQKTPEGQNMLQAALNPPPPPTYADVQQSAQVPPEMAKAVTEDVTSHLRRMRDFRRLYDTKRAEFYRQYVGQQDASLYPDKVTKRANTFVPYPFANVENIVSRTLDAFFSPYPWFDVRGRGVQDDPKSESMQKVEQAKLDASNFYRAFEGLVRNICTYGHAGLKVDWDWDYDLVTYAEPIIAQMPGPMGQAVPVPNPMNPMEPIVLGYRPAQKLVPRNRPKFVAIDVFDLLIDPDGGFSAHMTERTMGQLKREMQVNPKLYFPEGIQELESRISKEKSPDTVIIRMAEFWDETNNTCTLITFAEDSDVIALKDQRSSSRAGSAYSSFRRRVYGGPPILLWYGDSPFIHRKTPILHTSYVKLPNEVYGIGAIESISDLTASLNRFVNMITDNWNLGINRRYAYDTQADIDHEALNMLNTPGGKVGVVGDPSKVIFPLPINTPEPGDYALLDVYKGMIEMTSGISDFYSKGVGQPVGNRTATGINQIVQESNFRFRMFIRNLELDILQPMLQQVAMMIQQYVRDEEEVLITDDPAGIPKFYKIPPEELIGSFDFSIVAANFAENKSVRQAHILQFAELVAQSPYLNEYEALKELAKLYEIRNIERMLKTPQQVAAEQQAAKAEQIEMMIFESMLEAETQSKIAASKPRPAGGGQGSGGGRPSSASNAGTRGGKTDFTSAIRSFAQRMGSNAFGTAGNE